MSGHRSRVRNYAVEQVAPIVLRWRPSEIPAAPGRNEIICQNYTSDDHYTAILTAIARILMRFAGLRRKVCTSPYKHRSLEMRKSNPEIAMLSS